MLKGLVFFILGMIFGIFLLLLSEAKAEKVICYSAGQKVYDEKVGDVEYGKDFLMFMEEKSHNIIWMFNFDCVVIADNIKVIDYKEERN